MQDCVIGTKLNVDKSKLSPRKPIGTTRQQGNQSSFLPALEALGTLLPLFLPLLGFEFSSSPETSCVARYAMPTTAAIVSTSLNLNETVPDFPTPRMDDRIGWTYFAARCTKSVAGPSEAAARNFDLAAFPMNAKMILM